MDETLTAPRIVLFATQGCPHCGAARGALAAWGEPFAERDPTSDPAALRALLACATRAAVPTVVVGGRVLVGFDEDCLAEMLSAEPLEPEPEETAPDNEAEAGEDE